MTNINIQMRHLFAVLIAIAVFLLAMVLTNYNLPQSVADKGNNNNSSDKQPQQQQQDFTICVNKSMDKILNGDLNFSDPDPISHCFDQFLKSKINNGNGSNNNGGNNDNNLNNNSSFSNV